MNSSFSRSQTRGLHSSTSSVDKVCRNILGDVHALFNRTFGHLGQCKLGRNVESDVTGKEASCYQLIFPDVELAPDGLVIGVETPCKTELVETTLQLGQNATVSHSLHALPLVSFRNVATDEGERNGIKAIGKHFIDVVDEFARYAVLVGGEALPETAHGPVHTIPVESGEAGTDAQSGFPEIGPGAWENRAI